MAQEKLYLFELPSCLMAKPSASPPQIMWSDSGESATRSSSFHYCPYHLSREALSPDYSSFVYGTEERARGKSSRHEPVVHSHLDPIGYGDSADVPAFSHEIGNHAVAFAELHILTSKSRHFGPAQTASDQNREERIIATTP